MDPHTFPTKGNLMLAKNGLALAGQGFDLMDKKRKILQKERMKRSEEERKHREELRKELADACETLQKAILFCGSGQMEAVAGKILLEQGISLKRYSIMGVELFEAAWEREAHYPDVLLEQPTLYADEVYRKFLLLKEKLIRLSEEETAKCRLTVQIAKAGKRANALQYIVMPRCQMQIKQIGEYLEEKEREELSRQKIIRRHKNEPEV